MRESPQPRPEGLSELTRSRRQLVGMLALQVRDHGPGIPPEQRQRVLEAFVQGESARATGGNCGLGLAIVRRIVLACQGELHLDDAAGGGLAVTIILPLALTEA